VSPYFSQAPNCRTRNGYVCLSGVLVLTAILVRGPEFKGRDSSTMTGESTDSLVHSLSTEATANASGHGFEYASESSTPITNSLRAYGDVDADEERGAQDKVRRCQAMSSPF